MSETYKFEVHERLIQDTIRRQAGNLEKSILEAEENSIDAKATRIDVRITAKQVVIVDNGRGLPAGEEFKRFFMTFGSPVEDGENKTFGYYRIGRGQLFAMGRNVWRSGQRQLVIDLDQSFSVEESFEDDWQPGCRVEVNLRRELSSWDIDGKASTLREWSRYVENCEIWVNGIQANAPDDTQLWDHRDGWKIHRLSVEDTSGVKLFNHGVFVRHWSMDEFGLSADVVATRTLQLNVARNECLEDDPLWQDIQQVLQREGSAERLKGAFTMNSERWAVWKDAAAGRLGYVQLTDLNIVHLYDGQWISVDDAARYSFGSLAVGQNNLISDITYKTRKACVVSSSFLRALGARSLDDLVEFLNVHFKGHVQTFSPWTLATANGAQSKDGVCVPKLADASLLARTVTNLVRRLNAAAVGLKQEMRDVSLIGEGAIRYTSWGRVIMPGDRNGPYDAWTDGDTFIAVRQDILEQTKLTDLVSMIRLVNLLMHEYAHDSPNYNAEPAHDCDFYRRCEFLTTRIAPLFAKLLLVKKVID